MDVKSLLSIIIPVFNAEKFLGKCLDVLTRQKYSNIEILVIDDGSTDRSADIVKEKIKTDDRIKLLFQQNSGVSSARNHGLKYARGGYVTFVDADDYVENDTYETIINQLQETNADAAIYAFAREMRNGHIIDDTLPWENNRVLCSSEIKGELIPQMISSDRKKRGVSGSVCRTVYKKSVLKDCYFDERIHIQEDLLYCIKTYSRLEKLLIINSTRYHYVKHSSSVTAHYRENYYDESVMFEQSIVDALKHAGIFQALEDRYWGKRLEMYSLCLSNLFREDAPKEITGELDAIIRGFQTDSYINSGFYLRYLSKKKFGAYLLLKMGASRPIRLVYSKKEAYRRKKLYD